MADPTLRCPCGGHHLRAAFNYVAPPFGETSFDRQGERYARGYEHCELCGHWFAKIEMDLTSLYSGEYVDQTYGERLRGTFDRIIALPADRSDNGGRVAGITEFARSHFIDGRRIRLLDVGAGLGVFPYAVKQVGWECTALDPDPRAAAHIREHVGVDVVEGDFMTVSDLGRFDVVTFNKVLEHVADPVNMLAKARDCVEGDGFVYVELPDGEMAAQEGPGREEFFIEHLHVFSAASIVLLSTRAGFDPVRVERLQEPSTKYTLRAFLVSSDR